MVTDPGSPRYLPMWGPLVVFELVGNAGFIVAPCALAYLLFKKRRVFPRAAIVFMIASAAFIILDLVLGARVVGTSPEPKAIALSVHSVAASAIWIAYLVRSRRVAATFVT